MRRKIFILLAAALTSAFMAAGTLYAAECSEGGAPLEIVNKSGREIRGSSYLKPAGKAGLRTGSADRSPPELPPPATSAETGYSDSATSS